MNETAMIELTPLEAYIASLVSDLCPSSSKNCFEKALELITSLISGTMTYDDCSKRFQDIIGSSKPIERLYKILKTPEVPIPNFFLGKVADKSRKITRSWTDYEDQRLLAGIHRFGLDNWQLVAYFVGNGRTRAQCSQRWFRGLDPKICKERWTEEDERKLLELVSLYGEKSWTKIANEIGNRSDVQCRYHYRQISSGRERSEDNEPIGIKSHGSLPSDLILKVPPLLVQNSNVVSTSPKMPLPPITSFTQGISFRSSNSVGSSLILDPNFVLDDFNDEPIGEIQCKKEIPMPPGPRMTFMRSYEDFSSIH